MQSVGDRWYKLYNQLAAVLAVILLIAAAGLQLVPQLKSFQPEWQFVSYVVSIIALVQLGYSLLFYERIAAKSGYFQATAVVSFLQAINILNLIQAPDKLHSWFYIPWAIIVFASGIFSIVGLMCCVFLTMLVYVFALSRGGGPSAFDPVSLGALFSIVVVSALSYFFWRRLYTHQQAAAVAMLSGKLQSNEQQSEVLVQSLTDGVLLITTDGHITLMNPAASLMTGWTVQDAAGTDVKLVVSLKKEDGSELPDEDNPLLSILTTKTSSTETLQLVSHDNKMLIVSLVTSPVFAADGTTLSGAVAVLRDISVSHLEEKQRAEFISTASHEMRTPVAAIEGYLALALNEKVSKIDPKARTYLEKAHESTQHLGKLFQDLLMSAKAEDGRLVSHPTVVEMGAYIEQLAESFRFAADKRGLLTDFVFGNGGATTDGNTRVVRPLYYVHVDQDRIREVVTNLFDNAVKYTPSGKVSVGLTGNAEVVQIYVRDTGPGIPAVDLPHLFQKFYRVDNSATRTIGGTGLGLFICRKIVELYKGRIWVESKVGEGSTFYINLPRLDAAKAAELQTSEAQSTDSAPVASLTTPV